MRKLIRAASKASSAWQVRDDVAQKAQEQLDERTEAAEATEHALAQALQILSDQLERWATTLGDVCPPVEVRDAWITAVTAQTGTLRPREVLTGLLTREWLDPATEPLTTRVAELRAAAKTAAARAAEAERDADTLESAGDPTPDSPVLWIRRDRPSFPSGAGAPLWRLVDPVDGLDPVVLDQVEASLSAAGLLDAWVTPDGVWAPDRDGDELIIVPGTVPAGTGNLAQVLQPAEDAGNLSAAVLRILAGIGYTTDGPLTAPTCLAADGRWQAPAAAGRAGTATHGAELIGTAARAAPAAARSPSCVRRRPGSGPNLGNWPVMRTRSVSRLRACGRQRIKRLPTWMSLQPLLHTLLRLARRTRPPTLTVMLAAANRKPDVSRTRRPER